MIRILVLLLLFSDGLIAQPLLRTVVPPRPVVEGESFTIQYVWEDAEKVSNFQVQPFTGLRLVNGPISYKGIVPSATGIIQVQNFVFTVVAVNKGRYTIPLASGNWKGKTVQSQPAEIEVISSQDALLFAQKQDYNTESYLKPGEDPYKKINENLFIRVEVDKKQVVMGEPVVATYKLYSRLESHSEIVKNPGFYGFSVYDMVNLQDKLKGTETIKGKSFDVHVLRKVQLYPLQPGKLVVDEMEIHNRIYFSRSATLKKTEQEIAEGMLGNPGRDPANSEVFESQLSSPPVQIQVSRLTEKNKPASYSGAVGKFSVSARVSNKKLAKNGGDSLELTVEGTGNFIQVPPPVIAWPEGMEGFEATISDVLDRTHSPLKGKRIFRYPFASSREGSFTIPAVAFHFFDPDSGRYRSIKTEPLTIEVTNEIQPVKAVTGDIPPSGQPFGLWWLLIPAVIVVAVLIFFRKKKQSKRKPLNANPAAIDADDWLAGAKDLLEKEGIAFFVYLRNACWDYYRLRLNLDGSFMNKPELARRLKEKKVDASLVIRGIRILDQCDQVIFTGASPAVGKEEFYSETRNILEAMEPKLYSAYL